jgi:hypothetical protein
MKNGTFTLYAIDTDRPGPEAHSQLYFVVRGNHVTITKCFGSDLMSEREVTRDEARKVWKDHTASKAWATRETWMKRTSRPLSDYGIVDDDGCPDSGNDESAYDAEDLALQRAYSRG